MVELAEQSSFHKELTKSGDSRCSFRNRNASRWGNWTPEVRATTPLFTARLILCFAASPPIPCLVRCVTTFDDRQGPCEFKKAATSAYAPDTLCPPVR